ncbi:hypothetical protein [Streptomyces chromofuscus]|uniref:Uncharacterized protein n=1 Tax=Streptomyces chromofuscus TaxID=42881 RepID=A0A7M2TDG3_STRCW|nr:hypothetical protein [Streptomyces chromofuscus]QOV45983.1 hypothetical protein IPT68_08765 [Streptomyces chromofuscus]
MSSTLAEGITGTLAWGIAVGLGLFACMGLGAHHGEQSWCDVACGESLR